MSGFEHAEADRKSATMIQIGTVTAIEGAKVRVQIGDLATQPIPVMRLAMGALRLLEAGADKEVRTYDGQQTALMLAEQHDHHEYEAVARLLRPPRPAQRSEGRHTASDTAHDTRRIFFMVIPVNV